MHTLQNVCHECAGNPVNHGKEKFIVIANVALLPLTSPLQWIGCVVQGSIPQIWREKMMWYIACAFSKLKLGKFNVQPDEKNSWRTKCLWEEATRRGITMYEFRLFHLPTESFFAEWDGATRAFDSLPRPIGSDSSSLAWMDDKGVMRKKFIAAGLPVARGGVARSVAQAMRLFDTLSPPLITKPSQGSRSRHTTIHITTKDELLRGFLSAKKLSPWVVIEEELEGDVHRGTLVGRKLVAVMRREQPQVVGDGKSTVRQLTVQENARPQRRGPIFHEIPMGADAESELQRQHLTWDSVPAQGQVVALHQKVGRSTGASTTDMTDATHPDIVAMLEQIAATLDDPLIGVDFMVKDVSLPWATQGRCGVIECNSLPFIDIHHYPLRGSVRNVAGALWDVVFPTSKPDVERN